MRILLSIILGLGYISSSLFSQLKINPTQIKHVTVFRSGAQIQRLATSSYSSGMQDLVFSGFSPELNPSTIQVSGEGNLVLMSVSYRKNVRDSIQQSSENKALETEMDQLKKKRNNLTVVLQSFKEEESLLLQNKNLTGQNGLNTDQLIRMADIYRTRLVEVKKQILEHQLAVDDLNKRIQEIQNQLNDWLRKEHEPGSIEIVLSVLGKQNGTASWTFNYFTPNAGWKSLYDIRVKDIGAPLEWMSKAEVWQQTGENWKDVMCTLSTGDPNRIFSIPVISPWWLRIVDPYRAGGQYQKDGDKAYDTQKAPSNMRSESAVEMPEVQITEQITSMEFEISEKISLNSGEKPKQMILQNQEVPVSFQYYCAPKLSRFAYLKGYVTGFEKLNLSEGEANIYFKTTFVGTTYINPAIIEDTLSISLGPDIGISVSRNKLKDSSGKNFFGDQVHVKKAWELEIKNNKSKEIDIVIEDQIPLSTQEKIEVNLDESSGASLDPTTGILQWREKIKPGATVKKKFQYTVKYPKGTKLFLE
ncbi:MAG: DUF4139 domain-containing protein [Bacteroidota bacterium]|nr:DUF4139 domain-containing protein [Bacteroidota bacterium]